MDVDQGYAGIVQVSEKGADKFAISFAASFLDSMNAAVVDLRSDNEPGCRACWWVGQVLYRVSAWHQKVKLQTYPSKPTTEVKKEPTEANVNMEEEPVDDFMNVEGPWPDTP